MLGVYLFWRLIVCDFVLTFFFFCDIDICYFGVPNVLFVFHILLNDNSFSKTKGKKKKRSVFIIGTLLSEIVAIFIISYHFLNCNLLDSL